MKVIKILILSVISAFFTSAVFSETRITYKSAKSTSSYYQMAVQIADTMKKSTNGKMILTIEESQGSVQNVKEVAARTGNYVFTTPPVLVKLAIAEKAMFKGKGNPNYKNIRALFPIPSLTMHFVMSKKSGVKNFSDMAGKQFYLEKVLLALKREQNILKNLV